MFCFDNGLFHLQNIIRSDSLSNNLIFLSFFSVARRLPQSHNDCLCLAVFFDDIDHEICLSAVYSALAKDKRLVYV